MEYKRSKYLEKLNHKRGNGLIKIITGIRRCGKSYLLDPLFKKMLLESGVPEDHIIKIELDRPMNARYHRDAAALEAYIHSLMKDSGKYYLLLDEIQLVEGFELLLNGLLYERNLDIYITGSNSRFLSSDIITEFRGRGDQIRLYPLSFAEFMENYAGSVYDGWREYLLYGGLPLVVSEDSDEDKQQYLKGLFAQTYFRDIIDRYKTKRTDIMDAIVDVLASSVGSLTNPQKIYDTFVSNGEKEISINTVSSYMNYLEDAFVIEKVQRFNVKGRKYIGSPQKYYFTDLGLRNARLNFRQQERTHLMENAIYNELKIRGYNVDVGVVEIRSNGKRKQAEVDFVCNKGYERYYIQSALRMDTHEKTEQESKSLNHINDNFEKIIITEDSAKPWRTDEGILVVGVTDFMMDKTLVK